jgi:hypothetical protein
MRQFLGEMSRSELERLRRKRLVMLVLRLQRPEKTSHTSSKPPATDCKEQRKQCRPRGAKLGQRLSPRVETRSRCDRAASSRGVRMLRRQPTRRSFKADCQSLRASRSASRGADRLTALIQAVPVCELVDQARVVLCLTPQRLSARSHLPSRQLPIARRPLDQEPDQLAVRLSRKARTPSAKS